MRIVTLEEHFSVPSLIEAMRVPSLVEGGMPQEIRDRLSDFDGKRLESMDESGISVQVCSAISGAELLNSPQGEEFARGVNDELARAVKRHPGRLAGFAHLPMRNPKAAADELERAVRDLGFLGALIHGTTEGLFLDHPSFWPILDRAETLDVPLYIHPGLPPEAVRKVYYEGLPGNLGFLLSIAGFGWHIETGLHVLRLALSGAFTRHPKLKVIIGHMGEGLPFFLDRAEKVFTGQKQPVSVIEPILKHVWITTSGFFTMPPFLNALQIFGDDRILFSVDYPFAKNAHGRAFLDALAISPEDRKKIAHENADRLLKLRD
jgi:predicted TIM-barrel fold metal-dependent hydrolase